MTHLIDSQVRIFLSVLLFLLSFSQVCWLRQRNTASHHKISVQFKLSSFWVSQSHLYCVLMLLCKKEWNKTDFALYNQSRWNGRPLKVAAKMTIFFKSQNLFFIICMELSWKFDRVLTLRLQKWLGNCFMSILLRALLDIWIAINSQTNTPCVNKVIKLHLWCSQRHKRVLKRE